MRRFYGCNLTDVLAGRVAPAREVADWVVNLPPESAVFRAEHPDGSWAHTNELEMQRRALWALDRAAWYLSKSRRDQPEIFRFPWEEEPDDAIKGDPIPLDEAADWLGWTAEMREHMTN